MIMKNVFDNDLGAQAIARLHAHGKTNIRYSILEQFGLERIEKDLTEKVGVPCKVRVCYDSHEPMDLIRYFYCGDQTFTVRIPIMPIVTIEKIRKK